MSEAAISNRQLAIGQRRDARRSSHALMCTPVLPIAYYLLPIAAFQVANLCTVTLHGTSVTNLPLAKSVLITVSRLALDRGPEKRIWPTFTLAARVRRCSFQGGTCIQ